MSDYPDRISISPVYRQERDDDFYLVDRKAFPGKGVEYVRADRIEELEAKLEELLVVSKRAVRLSLDHADFKLYAMEPMHQAIAAAELKGQDDE